MNLANTMSSRRRRAVTLVVGTAVAIGALAWMSLGAAAADGCGAAALGSITESQKFTPFEGRLTQPRPRPINPSGASSDKGVPSIASLDGLEVAWASGAADAPSQTYYLNGRIDAKMTHDAFLAARGIELLTSPHDPGAGDFVGNLKAELGERAVIVKIGDHDAALTWADPLANGLRPHVLSWSDGVTDFTLWGDRSAEAIVNIARGFGC